MLRAITFALTSRLGNLIAGLIWLVGFMKYGLGYFDDETCRVEPIDSPFRPKLLPMSPE